MFWQTQQVAEQRRVRILELERQHRQDLDRMDALAHELEHAQDTIDTLRHINHMLMKSKGKRSGEGAAPYADTEAEA